MRKMNQIGRMLFTLAATVPFLVGCVTQRANFSVNEKIQEVQKKYAPDRHLAVFEVSAKREGEEIVLEGDVDNPAAKEELLRSVSGVGPRVVDHIAVLPEQRFGDKAFGIVTLSVATMREEPKPGGELGTQVLMGYVVKVLKKNRNWILVQSSDHYPAWMEDDSFVPSTAEDVARWNEAPKVIVTAFEGRIWEKPNDRESMPVSDIVAGCLLKKLEVKDHYVRVELPDGRGGFVRDDMVADLSAWKQSRQPTPENIEHSARLLMGVPYLWGGTSTKSVDCSGFTKTVFFLNGVDLLRNASHQFRQGTPIDPGTNLENLRKGDLIFFGHKGGGETKVRHVGIYLGDKLFIHSSGRVHISSLDPASPLKDEARIRTLLGGRRVLTQTDAAGKVTPNLATP